MKRTILLRATAVSFTVLLLLAFYVIATKGLQHAGFIVVLILIFLAALINRSASLKSYTYTILIFAAASTALFYPQYFIGYGTLKFSSFVIPLIQLIMFCMGTAMSMQDFVGVLRSPKGVLLGVTSHFAIMPLLGFLIATAGIKIFGLSQEIAAGIILIGCSPNGMASNVMSFLAKANLALSVTITAVSTLLAPFVTPVLMSLLAGAFVKINVWQMMFDIVKMVIIPIGLGILFNAFFSNLKNILNKTMPIISMLAIIGIIVIITAVGRESLLRVGFLLLILVLLHNLIGYFLGYWSGRLFKMTERDCRTLAIEVGMQNGGLASGLAKEMGKMATVGLAPIIFSTFMNVTGSLLATFWHKNEPKK
jgi:BASS family bile acid:Na+ symporter